MLTGGTMIEHADRVTAIWLHVSHIL